MWQRTKSYEGSTGREVNMPWLLFSGMGGVCYGVLRMLHPWGAVLAWAQRQRSLCFF